MQTSFNRGIWSSKLQNRFDIDLYRSACSQLENFSILPQGGIERRKGSHFLRECHDSNHKSLLIPFQLSSSSTFIVELSGNGEMRILQFDATTNELAIKQDENLNTGFTDSELDEVQWVQIGKKLYITHKNHSPRKLSYVADDNWLWVEASHYPAAPRTNRYSFTNKVIIHKDGDDAYVKVYNPGAWLKQGDVGRFVVARDDVGRSGYAIITEYLGDFSEGEPAEVKGKWGKCSIIEPFSDNDDDVELLGNEYYLQGNGGGRLSPQEGKAGPEGMSTIISVSNVLSDNYWRQEDAGRYIEMNGGFVKITEYKSISQVEGTIIKAINDDQPTHDFAIYQPEWGQAERHPKTIAFYENRLFYGGTIEKPGTIWGSRLEYFDDFTPHADDEYTLQYLLNGTTLHEVLWMVGAQVLVIGTTNGIWTIGREDSSAVLTPSVTMLGYQSTMACAPIRPATIGNIIFFAQRNKKILRSFMASASVAIDKATPADETLFADPFIDSNIYQIVTQSNPYITIWVTDTDGNLWGLNYIAEQQVNAWFKFTTDGCYESLMVMPQETVDDRLFYTVRRTIDGETKRYIEFFWPYAGADSMFHFTKEGDAVDKIEGLDHLEGKNVRCWTAETNETGDWLRDSDGTAHIFTVCNGKINIEDWGTTRDAYVGLIYVSTAKTMNWYGGLNDTSYESKRRLTKIRVTLLRAMSGEVGVQVEEDGTPEYVDLFDPILDPNERFTGTKEYTLCPGTGRIMKICLRQQEPDSITITGVGCNLK